MTCYQKLLKRGKTYQAAKAKAEPLYIGPGPELWKPIPNLDGDCFEASNKGRIRRARDKRICANSVNHSGYSITFLPGANPHTIGTANAVWRAWVPWLPVGRGTGLELDHRNSRKNDCRLCNLRPVPRRINTAKNGKPVQIEDTIFPSSSEAARANGVAQLTITTWLANGEDSHGRKVMVPAKKYAEILLGQTVRL